MKITRELMRRWGARYDDEEIAALVPADGLTPLEIAALDIPEEDRLWVLLREELIPARDLRLLACGWAEAACRKTGWDDERSLAAIAVSRRFAVGEATEDELAAAAAAAWEARGAAWSAAKSAWSPRGAAAEAAAAATWEARGAWPSSWWSVLSSSIWSVDAAAWLTADAEAAARSSQLADVVRVLRKSEGGTQK